jgi:lysophospholipase L1-like esterase
MRWGQGLVGVVVVAASFVALGSAPAGTAAIAVAPLVPPPSSMASAGDSISVGYATSAGCPGPCPAESWTTGTTVNSHYQRLLALNPALAGNAAPHAGLGATMSSFAGQVGTFAASQPDYVTVLLGSGDICFASTTPAQFGTQFRAGMDALFAASPDTRVLVASIPSLESIRDAVLTANPGYVWGFCQAFMNATAPDRALLTARLEAYNDALEAECATYTNCLFDGGALYDHVWTAAEVSPVDFIHPSTAGEEMIAEVLFNAGYRWGFEPTPAASPLDDPVRFVG